MPSILSLRWLLSFLVLIGNVAFWIHWFNRINGTGLQRPIIKRIEKAIISLCFFVPALAFYVDQDFLSCWLGNSPALNSVAGTPEALASNGLQTDCSANPTLTSFFLEATSSAIVAFVSLCYLVVQAPLWIIARLRLNEAKSHAILVDSQRIDMRTELGADKLFAKRWVSLFGQLPLNELHWIESIAEHLVIPGLPSPLEGLRIGHLSDIHLTGYMASEYYHRAVECLIHQKPDLVVLSGDIIDYDHCLHQIQPLLEPIKPRYGAYFVLGNHDRRLTDVAKVRSLITELGWYDLGQKSRSVDVCGAEVYLTGNERPWFDPVERQQDEVESEKFRKAAAFRIGVSHSPDQIHWAKRLELNLLFCGHNHGGQVRLPLLGPIVAPSYFGSRYACGWFHEHPTRMRVSRGLSGTQPLRFRCMPEVAVTKLESR